MRRHARIIEQERRPPGNGEPPSITRLGSQAVGDSAAAATLAASALSAPTTAAAFAAFAAATAPGAFAAATTAVAERLEHLATFLVVELAVTVGVEPLHQLAPTLVVAATVLAAAPAAATTAASLGERLLLLGGEQGLQLLDVPLLGLAPLLHALAITVVLAAAATAAASAPGHATGADEAPARGSGDAEGAAHQSPAHGLINELPRWR